MGWLSIIMNLIPIIAVGVEKIHGEKDVATKTKMAQDALGIAVQGAQASLNPTEAGLATSIGAIASSTLGATVQALHTANNPVPAEAAAA